MFKGKYSLEKSFSELKNLKIVSEFISSSENFRIVEEINDKHFKLNKESFNL